MYPALSVILFSTLSGAGYGLLFLIALMAPAGWLPDEAWFAGLSLGLALGLVSVGLVVSAAHLHHPERAWRAFSQWRSSWLSREGVSAVVTYVPALAFAWLWVVASRPGPWLIATGLLTAALAALTVYCTANIYACLAPIRQWRHPLVAPVFLTFGLMSGAFWLLALSSAFGAPHPAALTAAIALAAVAWGLKWRYWRGIDRAAPTSTPATAIGLEGTVRVLDPPHTEANYLLNEMGYRVARKHAAKLRRIALVLGFAIPAGLIAPVWAASAVPAELLLAPAAVSNLLAVAVERWLFFAEASHTVTLYYGR